MSGICPNPTESFKPGGVRSASMVSPLPGSAPTLVVSVREGTNNRRAFDAVRLLYRRDAVTVDAFYSAPVEVDRDAFDDQPHWQQIMAQSHYR